MRWFVCLVVATYGRAIVCSCCAVVRVCVLLRVSVLVCVFVSVCMLLLSVWLSVCLCGWLFVLFACLRYLCVRVCVFCCVMSVCACLCGCVPVCALVLPFPLCVCVGGCVRLLCAIGGLLAWSCLFANLCG